VTIHFYICHLLLFPGCENILTFSRPPAWTSG